MKFESVSAAFGALLFVGHGPYLVRHELEANGGSPASSLLNSGAKAVLSARAW